MAKRDYCVNAKTVARLEEILQDAKMENTSFHPYAKRDAEIKEAISLYMQSWVISPLERVLNQIKRRDENGSAEEESPRQEAS